MEDYRYTITALADLLIVGVLEHPKCMTRPQGPRTTLQKLQCRLDQRGRGCWFHQVNWAAISADMVRLLKGDEMRSWAPSAQRVQILNHLTADGHRPRDVYAAHTLLNPAIGIWADREGYTNGRHRVRAMQEAGVPLTVTLADAIR